MYFFVHSVEKWQSCRYFNKTTGFTFCPRMGKSGDWTWLCYWVVITQLMLLQLDFHLWEHFKLYLTQTTNKPMEILRSHHVCLWMSEKYENDLKRGSRKSIKNFDHSWGCKRRMQSSRVISSDKVKNESEKETNSNVIFRSSHSSK